MLSGNLLAFLIGGGLIAIPIVLHFLMQQKPKHLMFPAMRFLKERRQTNQRKLSLRHFLLLLLRCLVILAIAAALARPAAASSQFGAWVTFGGVALSGSIVALILMSVIWLIRPLSRVWVIGLSILLFAHLVGGGYLLAKNLNQGKNIRIGDEEAPVAAVLIFDTSPRMDLRQANQSRLESAREIADWVLGELPADSRVAVLETSSPAAFFSVDLSAARKRMNTFKVQYSTETMTRVIESAIELVDEAELEQKEIYLFTDMTRPSWGTNASDRVKSLLEQKQDVGVYVIDVGVDSPENLSLGDLRIQAETITRNGEIQVQGELIRQGGAGSRTIEFHVEKPDARLPVRRDGVTILPEETYTRRSNAEFETDGRAPFRFQLGGLEPGVHHGWVEIQGEDAMEFDNRRHFTIDVRGQWKTLVISPDNVSPTNVTELLSPYTFRQSGQAMFDIQLVDQAAMSSERFDEYAAIFILDPRPISEAGWSLIRDYAAAGGGVFIMLGHNAQASERDDQAHRSFSSEAAQQVLPGLLTNVWRASAGDLFLAPEEYSHEVMAPFRNLRSSIDWTKFHVYRHWGLKASAIEDESTVRVVTRFSNRMPALVEKQIGEGRILTMTTPYTDPAQPEGRRRWNSLPLGECWPTWLLIKQASEYLVQASDSRLNYSIGDQVFISNDEDVYPDSYRMFTPNLVEEPRRIQASGGTVRFRFTDLPGSYRLKGDRNGVVLRGFSVNVPIAESDLERLGGDVLDERLGKGRYQFATNQDEIQREQGMMRSGQEFYGLLVLFLVLCLALEHLLANRFYASTRGASVSTPAQPQVGAES